MEDYYKLIGVQPDDDREVIRDAYRARKGEFDAESSDDARAKASKLNRAWNVLSDRSQRAKYDDQLAEAKAEGTVQDSEDAAPSAPGRGRGGRQRADRPARRLIAQETEVNGIPLASNKDRGIAMAIDGFILFVLVLVLPQVLVPPLAKAQKPEVTDRIEVITDDRDELVKQLETKDNEIDKADDDLKAAEEDGDEQEIAAAQTKVDALEKERKPIDDDIKALDDDIKDEQAKLFSLYLSVISGLSLVAVLIFAVPAAIAGRSPGKLARKIRLRRETGEIPGFGAALKRYVPVIVVTGFGMLLGLPGLIALMAVMFGVTSFNRNPRRQGWHDRFAKTIVAAD